MLVYDCMYATCMYESIGYMYPILSYYKLTLWKSGICKRVVFRRLPSPISISKPPITCSIWSWTVGSDVTFTDEQLGNGAGNEISIVVARQRRTVAIPIHSDLPQKKEMAISLLF